MPQAYNEGYHYFNDSVTPSKNDNPHPIGTEEHQQWMEGYFDASEASQDT